MDEFITNLRNIFLYDQSNPLLFNTGLFMVLFVVFLLIYELLSGHRNLKMIFVILFSLYFYYKSSAECCFILLGVCLFDFILGNLLGAARQEGLRRGIVALNVVVNVGMLVYFKYFNLLIDAFASITSVHFDPLQVILPAGISFFTFRSISYIVDIYRGEMPPCSNFLHYTFYLTFFPPLLAGPVVRAKDMLPQVRDASPATKEMISSGFFLIICGLVKKVIIADYISGNFVDRIFDNPALYTGFENLMGVYGFALQLYCDFSGYSDMAIGIALLLGFRFKDNFNSPFKSQSPQEFWRRWHISLSLWLRDYLYIPLGGSRTKSKFRSHANLVTTMALGGLWHGASPMYIIWGVWNGLLLVFHKIYKNLLGIGKDDKPGFLRRFVNIFCTFNLIAFGFMFFRSESMEKVGEMMHQILFSFHADVAPQFLDGYLLIVIAIVAGYALHFTPHAWFEWTRKHFSQIPYVWQALVVALIILVIIQVRSSDLVPFIYLQY
ncbi:MAG: MBOAT family O-acyltransferase [Muribaculaceae bacterium]|nr:MBOAT family O-acyltransferase [Muribaculaceae bacterium]